jgi:hypothetical protein
LESAGALILAPAAGQLQNGVTDIISNFWGFAAIKSDGTVVGWGIDLPGSVDLTEFQSIHPIYYDGFAALMPDGSLKTWGTTHDHVMDVPPPTFVQDEPLPPGDDDDVYYYDDDDSIVPASRATAADSPPYRVRNGFAFAALTPSGRVFT